MVVRQTGAQADVTRFGDQFLMPGRNGDSFAALPGTVMHALTGDGGLPIKGLEGRYDRVLILLLDGFGRRALERHADHPFLRRFAEEGAILPLTSQFPSTTAAHITTIHTGLPVAESGIYEWFMYEPALDRVICPLLFSYGDDRVREGLSEDGVDPAALFPFRTLHEELGDRGVPTAVFQDIAFTPSSFSNAVLRGAGRVTGCVTLAHAVVALDNELRRQPRLYAFLYQGGIDVIGHLFGPSSAEYAAEADARLTLFERLLMPRLGSLPGSTLLLLTTDHGHVDVDPEGTIHVNERWPELSEHLRTGADGRPLAPAGSSRDLFLHVIDDRLELVEARLAEMLAGRAEVHRSQDLFEAGLFGGPVGERLQDRVGNLVVLPYAGETVWWREGDRYTHRFRGHHGGLTEDELLTYVAALEI
jgi:type I phosphodiesterase/nucleotide pyrophosphatase